MHKTSNQIGSLCVSCWSFCFSCFALIRVTGLPSTSTLRRSQADSQEKETHGEEIRHDVPEVEHDVAEVERDVAEVEKVDVDGDVDMNADDEEKDPDFMGEDGETEKDQTDAGTEDEQSDGDDTGKESGQSDDNEDSGAEGSHVEIQQVGLSHYHGLLTETWNNTAKSEKAPPP
jgi:hypothetical protein